MIGLLWPKREKKSYTQTKRSETEQRQMVHWSRSSPQGHHNKREMPKGSWRRRAAPKHNVTGAGEDLCSTTPKRVHRPNPNPPSRTGSREAPPAAGWLLIKAM